MEEIELYIEEAKELMEKAIQHVNYTFGKIRAGKATPGMLDGIMVEYYGNPTPLNQVSSVNTPDARSIIIKPWEKNIIPEIEKHAHSANVCKAIGIPIFQTPGVSFQTSFHFGIILGTYVFMNLEYRTYHKAANIIAILEMSVAHAAPS